NKVKPGLPAKTSSTFSTLRLEIPEICNQSSSYGSSLGLRRAVFWSGFLLRKKGARKKLVHPRGTGAGFPNTSNNVYAALRKADFRRHHFF
ncbi:MAG: hypothetical protein LBQ57_00720, partial [Spirochaetales bacterium]|nr:hypothetical protein [Spirochaetales bacterium]